MSSEAPALLRLWTNRAVIRAGVLEQALALDSFVSALVDPVSGSWVDAKIRWQDVGPHVREWRERVDGLSRGAAEIGDRKLSAFVAELQDWKTPVAELLLAQDDSPELKRKPEEAGPVGVVIEEVVERLRVLTRRARRQEFWIGPALVLAAAVIVGLVARL
jgi:hypothetical protein